MDTFEVFLQDTSNRQQAAGKNTINFMIYSAGVLI